MTEFEFFLFLIGVLTGIAFATVVFTTANPVRQQPKAEAGGLSRAPE